MSRLRLLIPALSALTLWAPPGVQSQVLGGVPLNFGSTRTEVVERLGSRFEVDDNGVVVSVAGPPFTLVGAVGFTDGKLDFVSRTWDAVPADEQAVTRAVVRALTQLQGESDCTIHEERSATPSQELEGVRIECGIHSVTISASTLRGQPMIPSVSEVWRVRQ
jgi:hypothetical protein